MVDNKRILEATGSTTLETATFGSLPTTGVDGVTSVVRGSQSGVVYVAITDPDGSGGATANDSNATGMPSGVNVMAIFETTPPTYSNGDPVILHTDNRGRLLVSLGEGIVTADVDTDQAAGPATPVGQYIIGKREATLPTYADGDNSVLHLDARGRLLVVSVNPTTGNTVDIDTEDSAGPSNPTGTFPLGLYRASLPTYTDGDAACNHYDASGRLLTSAVSTTSGTGTTSSVAGAAVSTTILAANSSRLGGTVYNDSTATLLLKFAAGAASATDFSYSLGPGATVEIPFGYTGIISGIWSAATGDARVTEFTA